MGNDNRVGEKARPISMISMVVRVDYIADRTFEPSFDKVLDGFGFFGEHQGVDQNCTLRGENDPGCDLGIHVAGKHVDIVGNTLALHRFALSVTSQYTRM